MRCGCRKCGRGGLTGAFAGEPVVLKNNGIEPAPRRTAVTWSEFLHSQAAVACDFVTIDTATMRRYYLLVFIDIRSRVVLFGGITTNPTGAGRPKPALLH